MTVGIISRHNTEIKNSERLRSLSNIYSPNTLSKIITSNSFSPIINRVNRHRRLFNNNNRKYRFSTFIHLLYNRMSKEYRNEYIYKNAILNEILLRKYNLNNTVLLNEFKIGKAVADLVLINGNAIVYELKTDLDNLSRLNSQLEEYKKAVDTIYIVTNFKNIKAINHIYSDSKIGLMEFTKDNRLRICKKAIADYTGLKHETIFKLLRKNEYLEVVKCHFGATPNVPNTKIFTECLRLINNIDIIEFKKIVFRKIRDRNIMEPKYLLNKKTPTELKFACYDLDLNTKDYNTLYKLLNNKI